MRRKPSNQRKLPYTRVARHARHATTLISNQLTRAFDPSARINDHGDPNRVRITDGRAAITKKVTADLDSDDEIIKTMKDEGQKDEVIRDRLIEEGRIRYNVKSISTRYARIRRAFHKAETENLDEDLTDWHQGDVSTHHLILNMAVLLTYDTGRKSRESPRKKRRPTAESH